jgi:Putative polyhydroxyalkanoic acid system protein (PHA_gran_rgn)
MPGFSKSVAHTLTPAEAVERLQAFATNIAEKYRDLASEMHGEWRAQTLHFTVVAMGLRIQGQVAVQAELAELQVTYPFAASFFAGRIEETMVAELRQVLN